MLPTQKHDSPIRPQNASPVQPPRLHYFISRSNGNIVPLIPADELPYNMRLVGVSRVMRMEQTCGMSHVGTHPITGQYFKLESDDLHTATDATIIERRTDGSPKRLFVTSDTNRYERSNPSNPSTPTRGQTPSKQLPVSSTVTTWRRAEGTASSKPLITVHNTTTSNPSSPNHYPQTKIKVTRAPTSPPSSSSSDLGDKIYCTHWIRHGECDYMQQGCRFKHEMPDKATLAGIGFRTVPRWWQERTAVRLGQSAIPTVGPATKPSEWLNMRRSSVDDTSDDESWSDEGSESGSEYGAVEDPVPAADTEEKNAKPPTTEGLDATYEQGENITVLQPMKASRRLSNINTDDPAVSTTKTAEESSQPDSPVSDLIDLDPASPTTADPRIACIATDQDRALQPQLTASQAPSLPQPTSSSTFTRKVFVPAGESTDFHIADARKHAQAQDPKPGQGQHRHSKDQQKAKKNKAVERKGPSIAPASVVTRKHPEVKSGLQASKHAPPSKHAGVKPGNQASKHVPKPANAAEVKPGLSASKHAPQPGDANRSDSPRTAVPLSTTNTKPRKLQGVSSKIRTNAKKKSSANQQNGNNNKQTSSSVCRPRRPAPPRRRSSAHDPIHPCD